MAISALEITGRQPFADGASFGDIGSYEQLDGVAHFRVDPRSTANSLITDIGLAPRDGQGMASFSADFRILRPADPAKGSRRLLFDVVNRGRPLAPRHFNSAPEVLPDAPMHPGNGFLFQRGYTVAWCGWQHDVPDQPGLLRVHVPSAMTEQGPVSGRIAVTFQPNEHQTTQLLSDRGHLPYSAADPEERYAELVVRDHDFAESRIVPRGEWSFGRLENGWLVPDASYVSLPAGFEPGKVYRCIYTTAEAPVVGLGLLGVRDFNSFLRYGGDANPCAGRLDRAHTFGASQSGRFLRHLLYLGLNQDEQDRPVFDGVIAHIAGARRGEFNQRFAQPSNLGEDSAGSLFPFADSEQTDPETGRTDGLLKRAQTLGSSPKLMLTNTSCEYWAGHAALTHIDAIGSQDIAPSEQVRIYHFAGTQHTAGELPLTDAQPATGARGLHPFNWVDYRPLLRAALVNLDEWASAGTEPPARSHPRLGDGSAATPDTLRETYGTLPGGAFPSVLRRLSRLDFGSDDGIPSRVPPLVGSPYPALVSAIDADGNETAGIRLPDVAVPLATLLGWNLRHPETGGSGQTHKTMGSTIPFPLTRQEREAAADPRASIEERYSSREDYLSQVRSAAQELVAEGYMLEEDLATVIGQAGERYDLLQSRVAALAD